MRSFRGAGVAREPGIQEHCLEKSMAWRVSMGSGPGPKGHPGTTAEFFRTLLIRALSTSASKVITLRLCSTWIGSRELGGTDALPKLHGRKRSDSALLRPVRNTAPIGLRSLWLRERGRREVLRRLR